MKIWLINHCATAQVRQKAGRHFWFANELKNRGYDVTLVCASTFIDSKQEIDTHGHVLSFMQNDGVKYVFIKTRVGHGDGIDRIINWSIFYLNMFPALSSYALKYGKPDVILASSVHPLTMVGGIQISKIWKIPCICEVRDLWPEAIFQFGKAKENSILGKTLIAGEHWIYKNADALVFAKEGDSEYLRERKWTTEQGGDIDYNKCFYINNGINLASFDFRRDNVVFSRINKYEKDFLVTYAGTLGPVNEVGNIIDAAEIINKYKKYADIKFLILGDGIEYEKINSYVQKKHIDNVYLMGRVGRKFIPYILSKSAINILNYSHTKYNWRRGNSSNKLFEYMASGKPIISNVKMGYSIIEKYECGVELENGSAEELADTIINFRNMNIEDRNQYGLNARKGALDFDFESLTDKLEEVIKYVQQSGK